MPKQQPTTDTSPADPQAVDITTNEDKLAAQLAEAKALIAESIEGLEVCRSRPPYSELKPTINPLIAKLRAFGA